MAIQLKDLQRKKKKKLEVVRELNYHDVVKLTMRVSDDEDYVSAVRQLQRPDEPLTKDTLLKANNAVERLTKGEAMLIIIGEYAITDWDVLAEDGETAPINGDNFMALCGSIGEPEDNVDFIKYVSDNFQAMAKEFNKLAQEAEAEAEATKKKPLKSGAGTKKAAS